MEEKTINEVSVSKWIADIKERLHLTNDLYHFDDLVVETIDGNKYAVSYAEICGKDNNQLHIALRLYDDREFELWDEDIEYIAYPNAIINAIIPKDEKEDVLNEIRCKLMCQPDDSKFYTFTSVVNWVELDDGNHFDVMNVHIDGDNLWAKVFSSITDEFEIMLKDFTCDALQEISDAIMPPQTLYVTACTCDDKGQVSFMDIYVCDVSRDLSKEQVLELLHEKFPVFTWVPSDKEENKFVHYPKSKGDAIIYAELHTD